MAAGAGAGVPASVWGFVTWPRAGLMGVAVAVAGAGLVAGAGAGNAGKAGWLVPMRERRLVSICCNARCLAARSLVAVVVRLVAVALVPEEGLTLVAARTGGAGACVAAIGTSKKNRRALMVFTMMTGLERGILCTVWSNLTRRFSRRRARQGRTWQEVSCQLSRRVSCCPKAWLGLRPG